MKPDRGAQFQISIDGVPRTYRDRKDIAFLKSRNPNSTVTLRDLQTGEEIVVAFKAELDAVGSTVFVLVIVATIIAVGFTHGLLAMALVGSFFLAALGVVARLRRGSEN